MCLPPTQQDPDQAATPQSRTAAATTYSDTNLPTGTYNVTASYAPGYTTQTLSMVTVAAGTTTPNVNIALFKSAIITGTISDSVTSVPLQSILVQAVSANGVFGGIAVTNSTGQYTLNTDLPTGTYNVSVLFPLNHLPKTVSGIVATAGQQTTVNISVDQSGIITGRITSATNGQPIAETSIIASSATGDFFGTATSNSTGYYQITSGLGTGIYSIIVSYSTAFNLTSGVSVTQGQTTANINLQLTIQPSGTITGKVTNSTGTPIASATVTALSIIGLGSSSTTTNSSGDYIILTGLPSGVYNVTVTATGYTTQVQTGITVAVNQVTANVNFQLAARPSGRISGVIQTLTLFIPEIPPSTTFLAALTAILAVVSIQTILLKRKKRS